MPLKRYEKELGTFAHVDDDEPVFVFRAKDPASVFIIKIYLEYLKAVQRENFCKERTYKINSCHTEIELFEKWQKEQEKLKIKLGD